VIVWKESRRRESKGRESKGREDFLTQRRGDAEDANQREREVNKRERSERVVREVEN